jgi:outer membrane protein insertion porin family
MKNYLKLFFLSLNILLLLSTISNSENIQNIRIIGNERIADQTIISFLSYKINDKISSNEINTITKELYQTNYFKDVNVKFVNNELLINVIEYPIIQTVIFNGIKSDSLKNILTENLRLTDRSSFVDFFLEQDKSSIEANLKNRGYYFSNISSKVEYLDNNSVILIYDIDIGDKAKIKKISFVGDKVFKDKTLKSIILSEEYKVWKFISGRKFLNEELVNFDRRLLRNFYLNNGFYNVNISSSFAKLIYDNEFELVYNISAGEKVFFGDFVINYPLNYDKKNFEKLQKTLSKLKGDLYSINAIEEITEEIDLIALNEQFESIDIDVIENFQNDRINLTFNINEAEKFSIKRINISGNNITRENVIRNQFEIDEGDFFNKILYNKSINNLKALNFFKSVNSEIINDTSSTDKIINVSVEEKPTGEIGATAGVATNANSAGFFVKENNYLGKGLGLEANITLTSETIKGVFAVDNPNFNDSDKSVYARLEATEIDKLKDFGYKTSRTGFAYGTSFEFFDDLNINFGNSNFYENIETDSTASNLQKKQQGDYWDSFLNIEFSLDKRNQRFKPSKGYFSSFRTELPVISDTNSLSNTLRYNFYTNLYNENITSFSFYAKTSNSLSNDNIKLTERNFLPSNRLRGFQLGKVGPKDGGDYIGGNYAASFNVNSTVPQLFEQNQNIDFLLFFDAANLWGVDYDSSLNETNKIRSSAGIAIDWITPVGPLNLSLSQPITKAKSDKTETFRFNLGTTF